ncbi:MAG: low molecular weight phosphotyrosine protein phosphatase [Clostridia bacterium]|nr:low molecular weight phosphotyrosine protein phosphatase [Clostridia bacterium]
MFKLVFVCHGNICRSPMAEAIMKALVKEKGLDKDFLIESRATSREEIIGGMGNPVHPDARAELARCGIPCPNHRATQLLKTDLSKFDLIVGMDRVNLLNIARIFGVENSPKVRKLLDFTESGGDVADPWYTDRFDIAYQEIRRGCEALLCAITEGRI